MNAFTIRQTPKLPKLSGVLVLVNILCLQLAQKQQASKCNRLILMDLYSTYRHL